MALRQVASSVAGALRLRATAPQLPVTGQLAFPALRATLFRAYSTGAICGVNFDGLILR